MRPLKSTPGKTKKQYGSTAGDNIDIYTHLRYLSADHILAQHLVSRASLAVWEVAENSTGGFRHTLVHGQNLCAVLSARTASC